MDVRGEIYDPGFIQYPGEISKPETFKVIPDNARTPRITAAAGTELAGASSPGTVRLD